MNKLPIIRFGQIYESSSKRKIYDCENNLMSEISMSIPFMFKKDIKDHRKEVCNQLRDTTIYEVIEWIKKAGKIFAKDTLEVCGVSQSPKEYCESIVKVTGMPKHMGENILNDFQDYMENIDQILMEQFRNDNLNILDEFTTTFKNMTYGIVPKNDVLCVVMPGNHPIVNMMWIIAFAMKYPIIIKPSFDEPYTPLRLIYSLIKAGADEKFFSYYPVNHSEVTELLKSSGRGILFGGNDIKEIYKNYPWIKVYGPGNSKIIVGEDCNYDIEKIAEFAANSALYHSGRACISTSAIICEGNGKELAQSIGKIFNNIKVTDLDDSNALLGACSNKEKALLISEAVQKIIESGKVIDMTPEVNIFEEYDNKVFLMPKVLYCKDIKESIFGIEYSFPFLMVGDVGQYELSEILKSTLSCCILSNKVDLIRNVILLPNVEKVFKGLINSCRMDFGMPHNGFLSDFLFKYKGYKF